MFILYILYLLWITVQHDIDKCAFFKEQVQSKPLRIMFHKSNYTSNISGQQWSNKTRLPSTACHKQLCTHCENQHGGSSSCHTLYTINNMYLYYKQPANHMQACTITVKLQRACSSVLLWIIVTICVCSLAPFYRFLHQTKNILKL